MLFRSNIKGVIGELEAEGHPVVYSDTDSIFVRAPVDEDVPGALPHHVRAIAASGDVDAQRSVKAWEGAKDAMVTFGHDLARQLRLLEIRGE